MPIKIDADSVLKIIKDKTFQKIFAGLILILTSFSVGRLTSPQCNQIEICGDIIRDRDELSGQLKAQYTKCQDEKVKSLEGLKVELDASCADRVDKALGSAEFDEDIHCPICVARGVCK